MGLANTPNAGFIVPAVESLDPLFHLFNGDLCYANSPTDRVRDLVRIFWTNNSLSARRPWMPSAGNHENEVGNGPQGYLSTKPHSRCRTTARRPT